MSRPFEDDRLSLIFTCCHPAINKQAQVALTLRTLGGLTTAEIARAFLLPEPTRRRAEKCPGARSSASVFFTRKPDAGAFTRTALFQQCGYPLNLLFLTRATRPPLVTVSCAGSSARKPFAWRVPCWSSCLKTLKTWRSWH